jgi:predicted lysophospholipase L1 biosynthesis ABC-type transport system permease subunit
LLVFRGVLRAIGATQQRIMLLFLGAAIVLAAIGGAAGLLLGWSVALLLQLLVPALPVHTPWAYAVTAEPVAVVVELAAGCCRRGTPRNSIRWTRCAANDAPRQASCVIRQ